jgi:hypothetical protein
MSWELSDSDGNWLAFSNLYFLSYVSFFSCRYFISPITVAAQSKVRTDIARSKIGIAGSNPIQNTDICVHLFCDCVVLCVGSGLATD